MMFNVTRYSFYSFILLFLFVHTPAFTQMVWTDISTEQKLPEGIKLFSGRQTSPAMVAYYAEIDLKRKEYIVHPYFSESFRSTSAIASEKGAIIAVNGGYFSSSGSTSAIVEPNEVKANNIAALTRSGVVFPVTRSFFAINSDQSLSIDWIYHFSNAMDGIIKFANPTPNTTTTPAPAPVRQNGTSYDKLLMGLGGGPTLIKNGVIRITHDEEVFFGSGIDWTNTRARTAVGFTDDQRLILLIVEEGTTSSSGATLQQVAELMLALGVKQAMNLDGGGSTTMAVKGSLFSRPQGGTFQRPMPSILAIVPSDSLKVADLGSEPVIIDTEMKEVSFSNNGQGWSSTANDGYYGSSIARIALIGDGSTYVTYKPNLEPGRYQVYGWWVASSNRAPNTPYTLYHSKGQTVQRVNQQLNNARWVSLGTYDFSGNSTDSLRISNNASASSAGGSQTYIVADAIRFVKMATNTSNDRDVDLKPFQFSLKQNYPNPFNPSTHIEFQLKEAQMVNINVYDVTGRHLRTLISQPMTAGTHRINFEASGLASGAYIYQMQTPTGVESKLMTLVR